MVKRWEPDHISPMLMGEYVLYSDYQEAERDLVYRLGKIASQHKEILALREALRELADFWRQEKALQSDPQPGLATWLEAKDRLHVKVDLALSQLRSLYLPTNGGEGNG